VSSVGGQPAEEARFQREVAQRVFAAEFNQATHTFKEDGDRSPTFVVSPFGAKVNRLLAVGVLTAVEPVGQTGDRWRAQVRDPTGRFNVYAGQYEPEATAALMEIKPPAVVAVVGKSRAYTTEEGATYVSVRPETISVVDATEREAWILETATITLARLEALREATKLENATPAMIEDLGVPKPLCDGVSRALGAYGRPDLVTMATMLRDALENLQPGAAERMADEPEFAPAASTYAPAAASPTAAAPATPAPAAAAPAAAAPATPASAPAAAPPAATATPAAPAASDADTENYVFALVERLDDGKGAPWEDIVAEASKKGMAEAEVEEHLGALLDKGTIYEPVLGRLMKADN